MYIDKPQISREEFISRLTKVDSALYTNLLNRGYKFYGSNGHHLSDGVCIKYILDKNGNTLFIIEIYFYVYDERFPIDPKIVNYNIEAHFYLEQDENKYCRLSLSIHNDNLDFAEDFLTKFFYEHKCSYYERTN